MSNKLFVGNLSFNTTENDLNDAFAAHGTVTETNLMMDRETGRPRGFGFVTMSSADDQNVADASLRSLRTFVSIAESRVAIGHSLLVSCVCANHVRQLVVALDAEPPLWTRSARGFQNFACGHRKTFRAGIKRIRCGL